MGEFEAAQQKHFRQISQAELIPKAAEHDLEDDVGWQLEEVEGSAGSLIRLASTVATPKQRVSQIGRAVQIADPWRLAMRTDHEHQVATQNTESHSPLPPNVSSDSLPGTG